MNPEFWLEARKVSKHFGAVSALQDVDLQLRLSEVVALVGDNGAGKSTLVKVLSGVHPPSAGEIVIQQQTVSLDSPAGARALGVATIFQELALVDNLTFYGQVLGLIEQLRRNGAAVLLVSHNLHDVFEVADRIVVLRWA